MLFHYLGRRTYENIPGEAPRNEVRDSARPPGQKRAADEVVIEANYA